MCRIVDCYYYAIVGILYASYCMVMQQDPFYDNDRALCSQCVARRRGEEVSAQAILLKVGLATLQLSLYTYVCIAYGQERAALLDRR